MSLRMAACCGQQSINNVSELGKGLYPHLDRCAALI